jgi:RNA polymerase sigma factor for flagellar operon FliA
MVGADSPEVLERFQGTLDLVQVLAKQLWRRPRIRDCIEFEELVAFGREGLLNAAVRFDPSAGAQFRTYAFTRVRGAMIDALRKMGLSRRGLEERRHLYEELAAIEAGTEVGNGESDGAFADDADPAERLHKRLQAKLTASAFAMACAGLRFDQSEDVSTSNPEEEYAQAEVIALLRSELPGLPPAEREIFQRFFFEGHRLEDIGRDLNMSKWAVCRLNQNVVAKLRERIEKAQ